MKLKTVVFISVCVVLCLLTACAPATPSALAEKYLASIQSGSVHIMTDCLAPEAAQRLKDYARVYGSDAGGPQLFNMAPGMTPPPPPFGTDICEFGFSVIGEQIDGDTAWVAAELEYTSGDEVQSQELLLTMEKLGGRWYVSDN